MSTTFFSSCAFDVKVNERLKTSLLIAFTCTIAKKVSKYTYTDGIYPFALVATKNIHQKPYTFTGIVAEPLWLRLHGCY